MRRKDLRAQAQSRKRQKANSTTTPAALVTTTAETADATRPEKVTIPGAQREAEQRKETRAQKMSRRWRNQGRTALTEPADWQTPHALFPGVSVASSASDRACLTPLEDRGPDACQSDAWVNNQMLKAYAHLIHRARMEERQRPRNS
jgi:hypothetical protein